jgi:ATP-dependent Lhr-like helicase
MLSLGPQHSFPLDDVFRYLHPATSRDVLVQALLDAPVFPTRWRWNATVALAVPRTRGGRSVPPALQRMLADDLMAAAFPDAAACLENIPGDRQIPDHPLVAQTIRDCLQEAMDFDGLARILERVHNGAMTLIARDLPEPSVLAHEILNARPYAFLDDAPLEERRSHAVQTRRAFEPASADDLGILAPEAIDRVRTEARPHPRDSDECHDLLASAGFVIPSELGPAESTLMPELYAARRAALASLPDHGSPKYVFVTAERLPELRALHPDLVLEPRIDPPTRTTREWSRTEACISVLRDRLTFVGPTTAGHLAQSLAVSEDEINETLLALESEGVVLRGAFTGCGSLEWCDRRLLARIHRYTVARLRAEIEPVTQTDFMRFLFVWQHIATGRRLAGLDGLREVLAQLDGVAVAAIGWERDVLPLRVAGFDPSMLDTLSLAGEIGWARRTGGDLATGTQLVAHAPIALFLREHGDCWTAVRDRPVSLSDVACTVRDGLRRRGASFLRDLEALVAPACDVRGAMGELIAAGLVTSDGYAGIRQFALGKSSSSTGRDASGRWSLVQTPEPSELTVIADEERTEAIARALLHRYGIVFRQLAVHEGVDPPWRDLLRAYRRLEARGEIRGGRFVTGVSGEQFALPDAVARLREARRERPSREIVVIAACDPLNLTGVVDAGARVRSGIGTRIAFLNGVAVAVLEGEFLKPLSSGLEPSASAEVVAALTGHDHIPVASGFVGRARRGFGH